MVKGFTQAVINPILEDACIDKNMFMASYKLSMNILLTNTSLCMKKKTL